MSVRPLRGPVSGGPRRYRRREPERSALFAVLQEHLEIFFARTAAADGGSLPQFIQRELRAFLKCGILAHGFCRVSCANCRHELLVAYSCKGRGFCPSCCGKRMTRIAEHLIERVVPAVPVRQWVLTVPPRLRYRMAYDHAVCSDVLRLFARALRVSYLRRARERGLRDAQTGGITFIQRFGSALNLNVHFHTQMIDGVFVQVGDGSLQFQELSSPSQDDVRDVLEEITCRLQQVLRKHGLDEPDAVDPCAEQPPLLAACYAGAVMQRAAFGPREGKRPPRSP